MKKFQRTESSIEKSFVRKAREAGFRTRKMNGLGNRSWPDQLVLGPKRFALWIEFKRPGEDLTGLQKICRAVLETLGFEVVRHDDAKLAFDHTMAALVKHCGSEREASKALRKAREVPIPEDL